jgi:L-ornithine Nalpha-acyltransferase
MDAYFDDARQSLLRLAAGRTLREPGSISLGRIGSLEARLTQRKKDVRKAQKLRYRIFFEDGGAIADRTAALIRRDVCAFDRFCDHLVVFDHAARSRFGKLKPKAVGTYRLLRQEVAERHSGFYSAREFDVAALVERHPDKRFLELGRSCVLPDYRAKRVLELLWRALHAYIRMHRIDVMIGCASLPGADPQAHATELGFLHHFASAREEWRASAHRLRVTPMDAVEKSAISPRRAFSGLPPLLKGYLRLGAQIGAGAVVDREFNTTDVLVILPVADLDERYLAHFSLSGDGDRDVA